MREILRSIAVKDHDIATLTLVHFPLFQNAGRLNSAGRYVASLSDSDLKTALSRRGSFSVNYHVGQAECQGLLQFLFSVAPERIEGIAPFLLDPEHLDGRITEILLKNGGERFVDAIAESWRKAANPAMRFRLAQQLFEHDPDRFRAEVLELCRVQAILDVYNHRLRPGRRLDGSDLRR